MADVTLTCTQAFAEGASVDAYELRQYDRLDVDLAPLGAAVATVSMTSGQLAFTGLDANRRFVAVVGARRVGFTTLVDPE